MPSTDLALSDDQAAAVEAVEAWLDRADGIDMTLGGFAGTGKTTIVAHVRGGGRPLVVLAPTGRAAQVLRAKGIPAETIHSAIYNYAGTYVDQESGEERLRWRDKDAAEIERPSAFVVDEASMVCQSVYDDLRAVGIPVLWVGDHGQLPPVGGDPGLMRDPAIRLERIHRQAEDSPILRVAHRVREGAEPRPWESPWGEVKIALADALPRLVDRWLASGVEQVACAYNRTRHAVNGYFRASLGRRGRLAAGERMVCLLNDRRRGLYNGSIFRVLSVRQETADGYSCEIEDDGGRAQVVSVWRGALGTDTWRSDDRPKNHLVADYGYCVTVHKAQGGQWDSFAVLDQRCPTWSMARWRYTAYTRAARRLEVHLA